MVNSNTFRKDRFGIVVMRGLANVVRGLTLVCISLIALPASARPLSLAFLQAAATPAGTPSPTDQVSDQMQKDKLRLEVKKLELENQKLKIENDNNERSLFSRRGFINLLYGNSAVITAILGIILGFIGFVRYVREKIEERRKREEERFEDIVKRLGGEFPQERVSAAVSLSTFLQKDYERFFTQVFALVVSHLRTSDEKSSGTPLTVPAERKLKQLPSPLTQALADVFRKAYPLARDALFGKPGLDKDIDTGQDLNAAGVQLDQTYLASADLRDSWLRQSSFRRATLNATLFSNANLEDSDMTGANLEEADLSGPFTTLVNVDFSEANLKSAGFDEADLESAIFLNTCADKARFRNTRMKKIKMTRSSVIGADFSGADLSEAEFDEVEFMSEDGEKGANPEAAKKLTNATFQGVKGLSWAQIEECKQKGANFVL